MRASRSFLRLRARPGFQCDSRVAVLAYHSIHPAQERASTTPEAFKSHVRWLTENCTVIPLAEVRDKAHAKDVGRPSVAITFDDGFADNYDHALPILLDHGLPATFFITTGLVNGDERVAERFSRLLRMDLADVEGLSWSQVREIQAEGMAIGAHTVTHPNLVALEPAAAKREIEVSKLELEDRLGVAVEVFAYPFGKPKHHFTDTTIRLVQDSGFSNAVAVHHRAVSSEDRRYCIPRFAVANDGISLLARKVRGEKDGLGVWQQTAPRWLSHFVSPSHSFRGETSLMKLPEDG